MKLFTKPLLHHIALLLIYLTALHDTVSAQGGEFLVYGVKDGLSQNAVHAIARDKDDLVWIGTQDGLNSFDGSKFASYKHIAEDTNSISDQFVLKISEDARGNLWVGTRNGLNYFDKRLQKFQRFYVDEKERHFFQSSYDKFFVQNDHHVLVEKSGLYLLNGSNKAVSLLHPYTADQWGWLVLPDYKGWLFSKTQGIYFYSDVRKIKERKLVGSSMAFKDSKDYFKSIAVNDSIFAIYNLESSPQVFLFNTNTAHIDKVVKLPANAININFYNNYLQLCTGAGYYEIAMDESNIWHAQSLQKRGLPPGAVLSSLTDKAGNLWLGTSGSGVAVLNPGFKSFVNRLTPVTNDRITGIVMMGADLFIATHTGLYSIKDFKNNAQASFTKINGDKNIMAIAKDRIGQIWIALHNGTVEVLSTNGQLLQTLQLAPGKKRSAVMSMVQDSFGRMLICTSSGVYVASQKQGNSMQLDASIQNNLQGTYYLSTYEDHQRNLWFAGNLGLDVLDSNLQKLTYFNSTSDDGSFLQRTIITSVTQDKDKAYWISTIRNGIYKYKDGRYTHYTHAAGLSSDICYNVLCDEQNRIWVSTSAGINIFSQSENAFKTISVFEGVPKTAFSFGSVLKEDGYLFFGAIGELLVCNTGSYQTKQQPLRAYISDVKVNGQSIAFEKNTLYIMPHNKLIRFDLAFSPAFYSGNIIYQYRLKGADTNWTNLSAGENSISYTGLPFKKLFMEVRVAGALNNLKTAPVFSLQIDSRAPFYKTPWFNVVVILIAVAIVTSLAIYYNKLKYRKQLDALMLEKKLQKERTRIGRDLHDNIGAYTSALIAGLNRVGQSKETDVSQINDLKDYGANIMGLLRETIWMLNAAQLTVTAFTDRFINYAMRINKNYPDIDFSFNEEIEVDKQLEPTIMLNLFRILQEALQNACKHADAANIKCTVSSKERLVFTISDDGSGFNGQEKEGHYGIDNMSSRAKEAGYSCSIASGDAGTTVTIAENTANAS